MKKNSVYRALLVIFLLPGCAGNIKDWGKQTFAQSQKQKNDIDTINAKTGDVVTFTATAIDPDLKTDGTNVNTVTYTILNSAAGDVPSGATITFFVTAAVLVIHAAFV